MERWKGGKKREEEWKCAWKSGERLGETEGGREKGIRKLWGVGGRGRGWRKRGLKTAGGWKGRKL